MERLGKTNAWTLEPGEYIEATNGQIGPSDVPITIRVTAFGSNFNGLRIQFAENLYQVEGTDRMQLRQIEDVEKVVKKI